MNNIANESILVIGTGLSDYKVNDVNKIHNESEAYKYGYSSQLYSAYQTITKFGITENIYMVNMLYDTDYPKIIEAITQNSFSYIVPLNVKFFDTIYLESKKAFTYYPEYLLGHVGPSDSDSVIVMTDSHASLYEDIDSYLKNTDRKIRDYKKMSIAINRYGSKLCYVSNNLVDYDYANLVAVCMLMSSSFSDYPLHNVGEAVFDIDHHDVINKEFCFFKYNIKRGATLENFHNFCIDDNQYKVMTINRAIKYVYRYLDLSEFCGRQYNTYLKILVVDKLNNLLSQIVSTVITNYSIVSCEFAKDNSTNTITILNEIIITPINSLEKYKLLVRM